MEAQNIWGSHTSGEFWRAVVDWRRWGADGFSRGIIPPSPTVDKK